MQQYAGSWQKEPGWFQGYSKDIQKFLNPQTPKCNQPEREGR